MPSRSMVSSSRSGSKPRCTWIVAPTSTAGVQNALSWAVWNIGIIATKRSEAFQPESSAPCIDSRYTARCEPTTPLGNEVVPEV